MTKHEQTLFMPTLIMAEYLTNGVLFESVLEEPSKFLDKYASYPHMLIADHREIQIVYNTGCHRPCSGQFLTPHMVRGCPPSCRSRFTTVQQIINFSIFDLAGLPLGQSSPRGEKTYYPPRSTILQNFSTIMQTVYEICITKVFLTFWPRG